jgi:hypothetical protein
VGIWFSAGRGENNMSEELKRELRMLGVLDYKTPTRETETPPIWVRDDVTFDDNGEPNF